MTISAPLYLGIDLGTGGVRALAVDTAGEVVAGHSVQFTKSHRVLPAGHHEQDPAEWWRATQLAVAGVVSALSQQGLGSDRIAALAVDGTSGTIVGVTAAGAPVGAGLMYNDGRATTEARELATLSATAGPSPAGQIAASYAIAKIRWLEQHASQQFAATRWFAHQADYIASRISGRWGITDYSNALKTGYDLLADAWPAWLNDKSLSGISERLPEVVAPGTIIGTVCKAAAAELGLSTSTRVVAGATDGTAGFVASGATKIGDDNTTLGTTLVFKRIATAPTLDPRGLIYCHKLPGGLWLPGAAGNTGCEWMTQKFSGADFQELDKAATAYLPCQSIAYPLARTGERFPFLSASMVGFCEGSSSQIEEYAAYLQGVALVERLCYETLTTATELPTASVYATGGGTRSDIWMQLRADVTGRVYYRPVCPESAFGAAVLAATPDHESLWSAIFHLVQIDRCFGPDVSRNRKYDSIYSRFTQILRERIGNVA